MNETSLALATINTFSNRIFEGDALTLARSLPPSSVDCVVCSCPYFGLKDYGHKDQIGLEESPEVYIARLVELFQLIHSALKQTGTLWLNLGDSYTSSGSLPVYSKRRASNGSIIPPQLKARSELPDKNLLLIPAQVALALRQRGWVLRSEIIWNKPHPMPESVKDRPTKAHEMIYMFVKSKSYWYDTYALKEPIKKTTLLRYKKKWNGNKKRGVPHGEHNNLDRYMGSQRALSAEFINTLDVWTIPYEPTTEAHYAAYPTEIPRRCILLGCPVGGVVLDPFMGSGTTALVAKALGRSFIGSEINPEYVQMSRRRIADPKEYKRLYDRWQNTGVIEPGQDKPVAMEVVQHGLFSG